MSELLASFLNRANEVNEFIKLIGAVEESSSQGASTISSEGSSDRFKLRPLHQRLLCSSAFLLLYNLVEATISRCVESLEMAATQEKVTLSNLSDEIKRLWITEQAGINKRHSPETQMKVILNMCEILLKGAPLAVEIRKGGGGNWDDESIEKFGRKIGVDLKVSCTERVKRPFINDEGALVLVKSRRNKLAHGEISFGDTGVVLPAARLKELFHLTRDYLVEIINLFDIHISERGYLNSNKRALHAS